MTTLSENFKWNVIKSYFDKNGYIDHQISTFNDLINSGIERVVKESDIVIIPKDLKAAAEIEPLIFNKQWYFYTEFNPEFVLSESLDTEILDCYLAGRPVENYFNAVIKRN